ncbi:adenosylcobinamide amidohydrolase [Paenibacillus sp. sptzw28]|uniref:adenosylcobinamide amidohydrolase n=1 Tax=Paenibacillus sp. sptzw28 TaxID=715179 RepID=UPI001C6E85FB|nr:adenosylcobinamide amidohydrolase [Paenibacillus sp. sptzw28]QYR19683.1 adenosylcobinamide amidohydrolase [Paenibacillus sp. sptzw28]
MAQPFRRGGCRVYLSSVWQGISICHYEDRIVIKSAEPLESLSSAVYGGGVAIADRFVNWKVPLSYNCSDPVHDIRAMLNRWGYSQLATVGLMTAAKLTHASVAEAEGDRFSIVCCTTAGIGNAARAGTVRPVFSAYSAGTINSILLIDGRVTSSAMVNAVITATEAKTAALSDLGIIDPYNHLAATGTTTDTFVIAANQSEKYGGVHAYAGSATTLGNMIGRIVYETVHEAVSTHISSE